MNTTTTTVVQWMAGSGVLVALLVAAAWIDWRTMRIPNWLTVGGMAWGVLWNAFSGPTVMQGLGTALGGMALGLGLFLPLWLIRVMGAGDVKLMAMVGAFLGAWATFMATLVVGIVGGVCVLVVVIAHRGVGRLAANMRQIAFSLALPGLPLWRPDDTHLSVGKLPYGVSICIGTVAFLALRQWGYA